MPSLISGKITTKLIKDKFTGKLYEKTDASQHHFIETC